MRELQNVKTCDLVEELKKREGVEVSMAAPNTDMNVTVSGPAIVLTIID